MSFDKETRNLLARTVAACRRLLADDVTEQLRGTFGLHPDGTALPLDKLTHLTIDQNAAAHALRELIDHYATTAAGRPEERRGAAYDRLVLEIAFTVLNRLAALRLCEERGLVVECVRKGSASDGFRLFERVAGGALGTRYATYKIFLECMFDELALDLGVLFDRSTPHSAIFPSERCLEGVLGELDKPELMHLWSEDETIGWIYQYFNPPEERKAMREASQAPRTSRELAVRNQFFTPRYVVEFLTDNTLGRIWYEMRKGDTALRDDCRYLVRRPSEFFLKADEHASDSESNNGDLTQEELIERPVYIEHRPKKDPRDLKILDPACGSGHFLLYAFDLLETIYEEAWHDDKSLRWEVTGKTLREDYSSIDELRRNAPKLILECNLNGIDIDARAVQIAVLALWLRAQTSWQRLGLKATDRPRIVKSNIVCAEPMPGEADMLKEFADTLEPRVLGEIVEVVFDRMRLAGEAGSLLKIEEDIRETVAAAKKQWAERPSMEQAELFPNLAKPEREKLGFDVSDVTDEEFWDQAEERILDALKDYAEGAENGDLLHRRLFAEDAARGFAFGDVSRKEYDVVLMNPPFGDPAVSTRNYIAAQYAEAKDDIYFAFVQRFLQKSTNGFVGVISNRTGFFLTGARRWREKVLLGSPGLLLVADLGDGVLDDALVEAAAYVLGNGPSAGAFFRLLDQADKAHPLLTGVGEISDGRVSEGVFLREKAAFSDLPESRISYWAPPSVRRIYRTLSGAGGSGLDVKFGLSTKDDFRFLRTCWEVSPGRLVVNQEDATQERPWMYLAKGGEYAVHFGDIHLVANWANQGREIAARVVQRYPYLNGDANWVLHTEVPYGHPGVTYTKRTTSGFSPRLLPSGCLISDMGCTVYSHEDQNLSRALVIYTSRAFSYLLEFNVASGDSVRSGSAARHYEIGTVAAVPIPQVTAISGEAGLEAVSIWRKKAEHDSHDETGRYFVLPWPFESQIESITDCAALIRNEELNDYIEILASASRAEEEVQRCYTFDEDAIVECEAEFGPDVNRYSHVIDDEARTSLYHLWAAPISEVIKQTSRVLGFRRFISKMTYVANRRLELLCHRFSANPETIVRALRGLPASTEETAELTRRILSYAIGCSLGRWDIRVASDPLRAPKLADPFDPLPVCPPGMLVNPLGLPAESGHIAREEWLHARRDVRISAHHEPAENQAIADDQYPLRVSWDGILVDDPGWWNSVPHKDDVIRRAREVLVLLWGDRAEAIEKEACEILGLTELRDYFRKPSGFFQDHLKRYSKSRRKAPIYWALSTVSGSYTVWVYYQRLTDQTLYTIINKYLDPKIAEVERGLHRIDGQLEGASGREGTRMRDRLNEGRTFLAELNEMREELMRIAALPYKPDLNDGVIINAAPFHKLFRLRSWVKDTTDCWKKLSKGDYDWAHLAYAIWPDRVKAACKNDRSIAIAHGLEDLCDVEPPATKGKRKPRKRKEAAQ